MLDKINNALSAAVVAILLFFVLAAFVKFFHRSSTSAKTFPSYAQELPYPRFPVLGHLPYFIFWWAGVTVSEAIYNISKHMGSSVFRAQLGSLHYVFLNDTDSTRTVLRSDRCGRRRHIALLDVCFRDGLTASNGERWRKLKKFSVQALRLYGTAHRDFDAILDDELLKLLTAVLPNQGRGLGESERPEGQGFGSRSVLNDERTFHRVDFENHLSLSCMNPLMWIFTGRRLSLESKRAQSWAKIVINLLGTGGNLGMFEVFPTLLRTLPEGITGVGSLRKSAEEIDSVLLPVLKEEMKTRQPRKPRHALDALVDEFGGGADQNMSDEGIVDDVLQVVKDFVCSGDTASHALAWCLVHAAANPWAFHRIQHEIDTLGLKNGEFPSYRLHHTRMPYTLAVISEALRLGTPLPVSAERYTSDGCEFPDFAIPKDTAIIPNLFQCHREKKYWPHPERFWPERFLRFGPNGEMAFYPKDALIAFSAGSRKCPGENLSWHVLFKYFTGILARFDLEMAAADFEEATQPDPKLPYIRTPRRKRVILRTRRSYARVG